MLCLGTKTRQSEDIKYCKRKVKKQGSAINGQLCNYATFQKEWDEAVGEDAAREFEQWKRCSEMLRQLQILRIDSGRTEEDIANILGWTEEQVLAFEMSEIQNVHFRDLQAYINAIDIKMDIRLREKDAPVPSQTA